MARATRRRRNYRGSVVKMNREDLLQTLIAEKVYSPEIRACMHTLGFARSAAILLALAGTESADQTLHRLGLRARQRVGRDKLKLWHLGTLP